MAYKCEEMFNLFKKKKMFNLTSDLRKQPKGIH